MNCEIWKFKTARFAIKCEALPEYDLDLSWDESGEITDKIARGLYEVFCAKVSVELDGNEISADYLGQCIYETPEQFKDNLGIRRTNYNSYFSGMVKTAISEARQYIRNQKPIKLRA